MVVSQVKIYNYFCWPGSFFRLLKLHTQVPFHDTDVCLSVHACVQTQSRTQLDGGGWQVPLTEATSETGVGAKP